MRAILFDCDGTLADSFGVIVCAMRESFRRLGLPDPSDTDVHGVIGLSLERAMHSLAPQVPDDEVAAMADTYRAVFNEMRNDEAFREALFPGIAALLDSLKRRDDALLGIVTGKSRRGVRSIVAAHGLDGVFQAVRTADDCPSKPHPAMVAECCDELGIDAGDALVVGDAVFDMQMALAAGAQAIGVAWGAASEAALLNAGAIRIVRHVDELAIHLDAFLTTGALAPEPAGA